MSSLRISRRAADRLRAGHLWVYRSDLEAVTPRDTATPTDAVTPTATAHSEPAPGSIVTVVDSRNIPLGSALYSSASQIAARLVSRTAGLTREQYLRDLQLRIAAALHLRRELVPITAENNAQRLLFSEADDLPGIVADRYNDLVILQLLTQATAQDDVRDAVAGALREQLAAANQPLTLWERPDPRIRELEQLDAPPPGPIFSTVQQGHSDDGSAPITTVFMLNGLRFHYDTAAGQKTGAFLDQRLNYAAAARHVAASANAQHSGGRGARALDVCTYHGGFALHLAQICARVTGVDASRSALEAADRNLLLNPHLSAETDWIEADAFEYLRHLDDTLALSSRPRRGAAQRPAETADGEGGPFDAIVLDPPAFAKSKRAAEGALRGYKELNLRALRLLTPGGTLITCSCSHHVALEDFTAVVAAAAADAGRRVQLLETRAAAPDHPELLTLPETRYLKCLICRVN